MASDDGGVYQHRHHINGVPHCPACGGMLWPPDEVGEVVTEGGDHLDSPLDADGGEVLFHEECFDTVENGGESLADTKIPSENSVAELKRQSSSSLEPEM